MTDKHGFFVTRRVTRSASATLSAPQIAPLGGAQEDVVAEPGACDVVTKPLTFLWQVRPGEVLMAQVVDFENVSVAGLESSPVAQALAGLRANEARYYKNKYGHIFTVTLRAK